jgi:hypothetical protein
MSRYLLQIVFESLYLHHSRRLFAKDANQHMLIAHAVHGLERHLAARLFALN